MPGESYCAWFVDCGAGNNNGVSVYHGLGFNEISLFSCDLKPVQRLSITRGEPASCMSKTEANLTAFDSHRFIEGAGVDEIVLAVVLGESP